MGQRASHAGPFLRLSHYRCHLWRGEHLSTMSIPHLSAVAPPSFPVVTICGSMRYYARMLQAAAHWTEDGYIVLMPFTVVEETAEIKPLLDAMHFQKIRMSSSIIVVGEHIGESTSKEIAYAETLGKGVLYYR